MGESPHGFLEEVVFQAKKEQLKWSSVGTGFVYLRDTKEDSTAGVGWAMRREMKDEFVGMVEAQILKDLMGQ